MLSFNVLACGYTCIGEVLCRKDETDTTSPVTSKCDLVQQNTEGIISCLQLCLFIACIVSSTSQTSV